MFLSFHVYQENIIHYCGCVVDVSWQLYHINWIQWLLEAIWTVLLGGLVFEPVQNALLTSGYYTPVRWPLGCVVVYRWRCTTWIPGCHSMTWPYSSNLTTSSATACRRSLPMWNVCVISRESQPPFGDSVNLCCSTFHNHGHPMCRVYKSFVVNHSKKVIGITTICLCTNNLLTYIPLSPVVSNFSQLTLLDFILTVVLIK